MGDMEGTGGKEWWLGDLIRTHCMHAYINIMMQAVHYNLFLDPSTQKT